MVNDRKVCPISHLRRNIPVSYCFSFFQLFLVIIPVLVPYWRSLGLSMAEVLQVQAAFGIGMVLFEAPTGYVADLWGRKSSVMLGSFITGVGFSVLPWLTSFWDFVFFEFALAFGASCISGADIALFYDSIAIEKDKRSKTLGLLGSLQFYQLVGEAVASLLGGFLVMLSFSTVVWAQALAGWIPFIVSLFFVEPEVPRLTAASHSANIKMVIRHLFYGTSIVRLVFINGVVWSLAGFCAVWTFQYYWQEIGVPLGVFGAIWAGYLVVAAITSKAVHVVERFSGPVALLAALALSIPVGYFFMASSEILIGVIAGALLYVSRGINSVLLQDALNWQTPSQIRATVNSAKSLIFRLSFAVVGPGIGVGIDRFGVRTTYVSLGLASLVLFLAVMLPLLKELRRARVEYIPEG